MLETYQHSLKVTNGNKEIQIYYWTHKTATGTVFPMCQANNMFTICYSCCWTVSYSKIADHISLTARCWFNPWRIAFVFRYGQCSSSFHNIKQVVWEKNAKKKKYCMMCRELFNLFTCTWQNAKSFIGSVKKQWKKQLK